MAFDLVDYDCIWAHSLYWIVTKLSTVWANLQLIGIIMVSLAKKLCLSKSHKSYAVLKLTKLMLSSELSFVYTCSPVINNCEWVVSRYLLPYQPDKMSRCLGIFTTNIHAEEIRFSIFYCFIDLPASQCSKYPTGQYLSLELMFAKFANCQICELLTPTKTKSQYVLFAHEQHWRRVTSLFDMPLLGFETVRCYS